MYVVRFLQFATLVYNYVHLLVSFYVK